MLVPPSDDCCDSTCLYVNHQSSILSATSTLTGLIATVAHRILLFLMLLVLLNCADQYLSLLFLSYGEVQNSLIQYDYRTRDGFLIIITGNNQTNSNSGKRIILVLVTITTIIKIRSSTTSSSNENNSRHHDNNDHQSNTEDG